MTCCECGHVNEYFGGGISGETKYNYYKHWGDGCVRERSKLLCSENTIWDWTARQCKRCTELLNVWLCNKGYLLVMSLETWSVTGNWERVLFIGTQYSNLYTAVETAAVVLSRMCGGKCR